MPSVAAIIFPFRRLAIWLSVLVLLVAALALGITALLVVPSLRDNLVQRPRRRDRPQRQGQPARCSCNNEPVRRPPSRVRVG